MVILVTGGAGFIGSTLAPMLLADGHEVRVLDNLSVGKRSALSGLEVELIEGDIRDQADVDEAVEGVDAVVHLAAHTNVIDSQSQPRLDCETNVGGTLNLLMACHKHGVARFVFASSNAPIGEAAPPIDESKPARPLSPYGASKLAGEGYCSAFAGSFGLGTVILRFANVYGPLSHHKGSVVARFIKDALATGELTIFGDGEQTRDFIYTQDLCRAIVAGLKSDVAGETFQIATGVETPIIQLARMVQTHFPQTQIVHEGQRPGEIVRNYSNIQKAQTLLHWTPQVFLEEGLSNTVQWFRSL